MSRFLLTALQPVPGSGGVRAALPVAGDTTGIRTAADGSGELYHAVLDTPLRYRGADIRQVIMRPAQRGQVAHFGMRGFPVEIAPVIDPALRTAPVIDPVLLEFVATGEIDDDSQPAPPPPREQDDPVAGFPPSTGAPRRAEPPPAAARPGTRSRRPVLIGAVAAAILAGLGVWWLTRSATSDSAPAASSATSSATQTSTTTSTSSTPTSVAPVAKPEDMMRLLPPGYPAGACTADTGVPAGARGALSCRTNIDPGGPTRGRYTLAADPAALRAQFEQVVASSVQQECPGRIMSPGAWHRLATPQEDAGILYCGVREGVPLIAWTDESKLLLAVVDSPEGKPSIEDMFTWWSSHS